MARRGERFGWGLFALSCTASLAASCSGQVSSEPSPDLVTPASGGTGTGGAAGGSASSSPSTSGEAGGSGAAGGDGSDDTSPECRDSTRRCAGATLQLCVADQGWVTLATCAQPSLCDPREGSCQVPECLVGEHRCDGQYLMSCGADRRWMFEKDCLLAGACQPTGHCVLPECIVLMVRCSENQIQTCGPNQAELAWSTVEVCGEDELCQYTSGDAACVAIDE